jgi:hypothetical protein
MNYRSKNIFIFFIPILLFCSCAPAIKLVFNIKNPKIYSSYTEVEPILVSQINKLGIKDYTILYSYETCEESKPLYFDGDGRPISRTKCGIIDITDTLPSKISYQDTVSFNYVIQDLVTKDSLPFTKNLVNYDYIVVMPKTTFFVGVEKRTLRDIRLTIPSETKIYYLFVNTDFYLWQDSRFKAGQKGKIKIQKEGNERAMTIGFRERTTKVKKNESIEK